MTTLAPNRQLLLLETDDERSPEVEAALVDAGFTIRRCAEPDDPSFPCALLKTGRCPLDDGLVDVALDVRKHPWPYPTAREHGVQCALRQRVPVVVAGAVRRHPFEQWAAITVDGTSGVSQACEVAVQLRLEGVRSAVRDAVGAVLHTHGIDSTPVTVTANRQAGTLLVRVESAVPTGLRTTVAARAGAAARRADALASAIELDLVDGAPCR
jgi:hypothetical protein